MILTLKNFVYFSSSVNKLSIIYRIFPLTFLWSLNLLVFIKKTVCVLCEIETKFLNKNWIHYKNSINCDTFYYVLRIVLLFVQNAILKDKNDYSKHFMMFCFFWNALGIEKLRKKEWMLRGQKNVGNCQIAWATWIGKKKRLFTFQRGSQSSRQMARWGLIQLGT